MIHHVEDSSNQAQGTIHAQQQGNQAQMPNGGVGQHPFHVILENRGVRTHDQRNKPSAANNPEPFIGAGQDRPETREQEDTCFHHSGRM